MRMSRAALVRIAPFAAFMLLLWVRAMLPADGSAGIDPRWIYGAAVVIVGTMLAVLWTEYGELVRQTLPSVGETALAIAVGGFVFVLWVVLDAGWMRIGEPSVGFVPADSTGRLLWPLIVVRWIGAALIVPVMEELFWRSFLMRWLERAQFESVVPQSVGARAIVLSTFVFTLEHTQWLAAVIAGLAYAGLYRRTGKLWVPVIAHAVTNGVLGAWVIYTQRWAFW